MHKILSLVCLFLALSQSAFADYSTEIKIVLMKAFQATVVPGFQDKKDHFIFKVDGHDIPVEMKYNSAHETVSLKVRSPTGFGQGCLHLELQNKEKALEIAWLGTQHVETGNTLDCPGPKERAGQFFLDFASKVAQAVHYHTMTLQDASYVFCAESKKKINLRLLNLMTQGRSGWYEKNGFSPQETDMEKLKEMITVLRNFPLSKTLEMIAAIDNKTIEAHIAKYLGPKSRDHTSSSKLEYWRQLKPRRDLLMAAAGRFLQSESHSSDCFPSQKKDVGTATQELLEKTFPQELQTALETHAMQKKTVSDLLTFIYKPDRSGCELYAEVADLLFPIPWQLDHEELQVFKNLFPGFINYYNVLETGFVLEKKL